MKINDEQKVSVLMQALEERYRSIHAIRERVQTVSIWILGILLGTSGWLFQSNIRFDMWYQKLFLIVLLFILWGTLRWFYFNDLQKGFNTQRQVAATVEDLLGLFNKNVYGSVEPIYPKEWKSSGEKGSEGKFFDNTYNLIVVGFGVLSLVIVFLK
ncbi:MAG: hypothetical protein A3I68_01635 [Candidatus Melainabacteria bacterium RIFCSPLOWO2_02_FULL_35_15]|nr:MAG: hypothetical protein A3F80_04945 [Candidatus Melainabacteria bacterium RIFCSPLOWO2_12_FULL_35_11]OGI13012.1 MAG: hypothetical protein A3I68_01635 [Candidatus Melainabacteria bacterium RIFCSPLOWO2_02_FULL_35_15]